jgi:FAD binding domain
MAALGPLWARELLGTAKNLARHGGPGDLGNATGASPEIRRRRPSDVNWPSQAAWKRLRDEVDGNLIPVEFPIAACVKDTGSAGCQNLLENIHNPYYIGDQPGLTQTLGWVDAWVSKPSVYAVAASDAKHVAAAVNFARENDLRLVVKGGGHSYQGTSNAADSLLVWTRHMHDITSSTGMPGPACPTTRGDSRLGCDLEASIRRGDDQRRRVCARRRLHYGRRGGPRSERGLRKFFEALWNRGGGIAGGGNSHRRWESLHRECMYEPRSILGAEGWWRRNLRSSEQSDVARTGTAGILGGSDS